MTFYFYTVHFAPALLLHQYLTRPFMAVLINLVPRLSWRAVCRLMWPACDLKMMHGPARNVRIISRWLTVECCGANNTA